jgi:hypothetical protein
MLAILSEVQMFVCGLNLVDPIFLSFFLSDQPVEPTMFLAIVIRHPDFMPGNGLISRSIAEL